MPKLTKRTVDAMQPQAGSAARDYFVWDAVHHAAGLPDVRLHDLRHAFASFTASGGLTLPLIGALLGHTDAATKACYAHLVESSRRRAAESVSGAIAAALAGQFATPTGGVQGPDSTSGRVLELGRPA